MKKAETVLILRMISSAYPSFEVIEDLVKIWQMMMGDISFNEAQAALRKHIENSVFAPSISEILHPPQPKKSTYEMLQEQLRDMALDSALREWSGDCEFPIREFLEAFDREEHEEFLISLQDGKALH